ncbi:hypothetical protein V7L32_004297 [Salmonella enterica]
MVKIKPKYAFALSAEFIRCFYFFQKELFFMVDISVRSDFIPARLQGCKAARPGI